MKDLTVFRAEGIFCRLLRGERSLPGKTLDRRIGNAVRILFSRGTTKEDERQQYNGEQ